MSTEPSVRLAATDSYSSLSRQWFVASPAAIAAQGIDIMSSQDRERDSGVAPSLRLATCAYGKAVAGFAAAAALSSFAFLVFGPVADQRSLDLAGVVAGPPAPAVGTRAESGPVLPQRWAGAAPRPFYQGQ